MEYAIMTHINIKKVHIINFFIIGILINTKDTQYDIKKTIRANSGMK